MITVMFFCILYAYIMTSALYIKLLYKHKILFTDTKLINAYTAFAGTERLYGSKGCEEVMQLNVHVRMHWIDDCVCLLFNIMHRAMCGNHTFGACISFKKNTHTRTHARTHAHTHTHTHTHTQTDIQTVSYQPYDTGCKL